MNLSQEFIAVIAFTSSLHHHKPPQGNIPCCGAPIARMEQEEQPEEGPIWEIPENQENEKQHGAARGGTKGGRSITVSFGHLLVTMSRFRSPFCYSFWSRFFGLFPSAPTSPFFGCARGAAKASCGETVIQNGVLESPFLLCPLTVFRTFQVF